MRRGQATARLGAGWWVLPPPPPCLMGAGPVECKQTLISVSLLQHVTLSTMCFQLLAESTLPTTCQHQLEASLTRNSVAAAACQSRH
jgi:hypothetical protein